MSIIESLFGWRRRAVDASAFLTSDGTSGSTTFSGIEVDDETAMRLIAVYACITLISDTIATLPVDRFRGRDTDRQQLPAVPWMDWPNNDQSWRQFTQRVVGSLLTYGNAYLLVSGRDRYQFPSEFFLLHPSDVVVKTNGGKDKMFEWGPDRQLFTHYTSRKPSGQVVHLMAYSHDGQIGLSPIEVARQGIGLGLAAEKYGSKFFGNSTTMNGVVELPQGVVPSEDQLRMFSSEWRRIYSGTDNAFKTPVLSNGASWKPISLPNDQAQFIETRSFTISEIARLFRVPPHMIGEVDRSTSWGSGIEQQGIGFVTYTLGTWIDAIEEAFTALLPRGQYLKVNTNALLRGDIQSRYTAYATAVTNGWMSRNEVRVLEDRPPLDGLDDILQPLNMETVGADSD